MADPVIRLTAKDDTATGFASVRSNLAELGSRADAASRSFAALRTSFVAVFAGAAVRQVVQAADSYSNLNARLSLVTNSTREFAQAQERLFGISQQTRTGLEATTDLFTSLSRSTQALGATQEQVLGVTQTINQALIVSGGSAQSAAAALVQLGQGFASGVLRGEELNSVLEQAPRLAQAIADGMGVPLGKLRELGKAGKLTADEVFKALQSQAGQIASEFGRLPITVGGAVQQVQNSLLLLTGAANDATGAQAGLADALSTTAKFIAEVAREIQQGAKGAEDIGFWAEAFLAVSETLRVLGANVKFVFTGIGRDIGAIGAQLAALARLDFEGFTAISDAVREDARKARAELDKFERQVLGRFRLTGERLNATTDPRSLTFGQTPRRPAGSGGDDDGKTKKDPYAEAVKSLRQHIALVGQKTEVEKISAQIELGNFGKLSKARADALRQLAAQLDAARDRQATADAGLGVDLAKIQRDLSAITSAYASSEAILEAQRAAGLVADREYFTARIGLLNLTADAQVRALQQENTRLAAEKATGADRIKNLEKIADNEGRIAQIQAEAAARGTVLSIQQASAVKEIQVAYQEAEAAAQAYLDTLRLQQRRELEAAGQGGQERERIRGRAEIEDRYQQQLLQLESDRRQGLPDDQYRQELARIQRFQAQALSDWDSYFAARIAQERNFNVGASEAFANYITEAQNLAQQAEDLFTRSFRGMEDALVSFVQTGKLDFKGLADSIVADLTRIIVRQQVMLPLLKAMGGEGGGAGLVGSFVGALFGGARASGGPVSAGRAYLVGERGPELIVPSQAGTVIPNGQLAGAKTVTNHITINVPQSTSRESANQLAAELARRLAHAHSRNG